MLSKRQDRAGWMKKILLVISAFVLPAATTFSSQRITRTRLLQPWGRVVLSRKIILNAFDEGSFEPVHLPDDQEKGLDRNQLERLTVPQLKQQLRLRGLPVSGRKHELVERLLGKKSSSKSQEQEFVNVTAFLDDDDQGEDVKSKILKDRGTF